MIKFSKVSKKFADLVILDQIDLQIGDKEFVFLIGPTGAGKTTLFRLLRREILPTTGSIEFNGAAVEKLQGRQIGELRRQIGTVFQDLKLLADRTVRENVALALKILGKDEKQVETEVGHALELVGLEGKGGFFPSQLSGGELQRVAIARAVVTQPPLVLADEPTGNLDPATSWQIMKLLQKINQMGRTVIVATHNFEVVNSLKKRVVELDKGKIVSDEKKGQYKVK